MAIFDFNSYGGANQEDPPADEDRHDAAIQDMADQAIQGLQEDDSEDDEEDQSYMDDVDQRLEVTTYYRELLRGSLFNQQTAASKIVEREVRTFVRRSIEVLLGIRKGEEKAPPQPVFPFSEEQVHALKVFADRLNASPLLAQAAKAEPSLRTSQAPPASAAPALISRGVKQPEIIKPVPKAPVQQPLKVAVVPPPPPKKAAPPPVKPAPKHQKQQKKQPLPKKDDGPVPQTIEEVIAHPQTGEPMTITKSIIHRPEGRLPFPTDQQLEIMTHQNSLLATSGGGAMNSVQLSGLVNLALKE